ncbi:hypothetical protein K501DRAFT_283718 [Backusella circina FSU 941]|nr:hypothetical protein K501DRAFT_283718 [Backusella circina FSU 941]
MLLKFEKNEVSSASEKYGYGADMLGFNSLFSSTIELVSDTFLFLLLVLNFGIDPYGIGPFVGMNFKLL